MLRIGNVNLDPPLFLAPMAGVTDPPFRTVARSLGCAFAFTEMISANALAYGSKASFDMLASTAEDRPLGTQIVGCDPEIVRKAADLVAPYAFDILDFNAGCPVHKVVSKGEGAELLREPEKLQQLLEIVVRKSAVPVTVKIRSGWDESSVNAVETARRAQDAGVSAVFVHGRTRAQGYRGNVDYTILRKVKESVSIPMIACGDALTAPLIKRLFDETGCDGVSVARGALGNPWIFRQAAELLAKGSITTDPDAEELARTMRRHLDLNISYYGEEYGVITFRKLFAWYVSGKAAKELKAKSFAAKTRADMSHLIDMVAEKKASV